MDWNNYPSDQNMSHDAGEECAICRADVSRCQCTIHTLSQSPEVTITFCPACQRIVDLLTEKEFHRKGFVDDRTIELGARRPIQDIYEELKECLDIASMSKTQASVESVIETEDGEGHMNVTFRKPL